MININLISNTIWNTAGVLRGPFSERRYRDFILPFVVLRRFECALAPTKQAVLAQFEELGEENETILKHTGKLDFYNIARFDLNELCKDPTTILHDLKKYIDGFSANVKEIFKKFQFIKLIEELHEKNKLFTLCNLYKDIDLSLKTISNADMGYVFEETLRRFNDQNPDGEHYTAPEVIRLLSRVLIAGDNRNLTPSHLIKIMDAACGTGGMLFGLKKELVETLHINPDNITVFGQENNGETYAIACSDMLIKGEDPSDIKYGSTLQADQSSGELMDFVIMNPPFGVEWGPKKSQEDYAAVFKAHNEGTRFIHGLPPVDNGQLLFIQHGIDKLLPTGRGAIMSDNNPFSAGKAGSGNSEIRKWMIESDVLEACVRLPGKLFYNTGITTYFWLFNKNKPKERKNKVLFIDASSEDFYAPMAKGLGDKHNEIKDEHITKIVELYQAFQNSEYTKVIERDDLLFDEVSTRRKFQRSYILNEETLEKIKLGTKFNDLVEKFHKDEPFDEDKDTPVIEQLAVLKELNNTILTNDQKVVVANVEKAIQQQTDIINILSKDFDHKKFVNRNTFANKIYQLLPEWLIRDNNGKKQKETPLLKEIIDACGEYDEDADIIDNQYDSEFNDTEILKHNENIDEYYAREVQPYAPTTEMIKDSLVVGCKIEWNKIFPKVVQEPSIKEILLELKKNVKEMSDLEKEIDEFFKEIVE